MGWTQHKLGLELGIESDKAQARISHYEQERREIPRSMAYAFIDLASKHGVTYVLEDLYPRPVATA